MLDSLWNGTETILSTFFRLDLHSEADDELSFELRDVDASVQEENKLKAIFVYLLNVR